MEHSEHHTWKQYRGPKPTKSWIVENPACKDMNLVIFPLKIIY